MLLSKNYVLSHFFFKLLPATVDLLFIRRYLTILWALHVNCFVLEFVANCNFLLFFTPSLLVIGVHHLIELLFFEPNHSSRPLATFQPAGRSSSFFTAPAFVEAPRLHEVLHGWTKPVSLSRLVVESFSGRQRE